MLPTEKTSRNAWKKIGSRATNTNKVETFSRVLVVVHNGQLRASKVSNELRMKKIPVADPLNRCVPTIKKTNSGTTSYCRSPTSLHTIRILHSVAWSVCAGNAYFEKFGANVKTV
jgi:hypothetical protein